MSNVLQWIIVAVAVAIAVVFLIRHLGREKCACPYAGTCGRCCDSKQVEHCAERTKLEEKD